MFAFCSIIVVTTQFLSPALHKNFSEADFDFKVCVWGEAGGSLAISGSHLSRSNVRCCSLHGLGVELLLQPHCSIHQPAQPAAGGASPGEEEEDTGQVRGRVWRCSIQSSHLLNLNVLSFN